MSDKKSKHGKHDKDKKDKKGRKKRSKSGLDYFEAFEQQAGYVTAEADLLGKVLKDFTTAADIEKRLGPAHAIEHAADELILEILAAIETDFITPIEREDIVELSTSIDRVVNGLEAIVRHLFMYDVESVEPAAAKMCKLVRKECGILQDAMRYFREFRKPKKLKEKAREITALEDEVDTIYIYAIRELFGSGREPEQIIKWRSVYTTIEECSDAVEYTTDVMKRIILKNL